MVKVIGKEEFENDVLTSKKICLVDFFATWCGPCNMLAPVLEELSKSEKYKEKLELYKIDVDENPEIAISFEVEVVPTIVFFKEGKVLRTETVFRDLKELEEIIEELI